MILVCTFKDRLPKVDIVQLIITLISFGDQAPIDAGLNEEVIPLTAKSPDIDLHYFVAGVELLSQVVLEVSLSIFSDSQTTQAADFELGTVHGTIKPIFYCLACDPKAFV